MKAKRWFVLFSMLACAMMLLPVKAADDVKKTEEHGTVIFYRTRNAKGAAIGLNITGGADGKVGVLKNGSKIVKELPAGQFTFTVSAPSVAGQDSLIINVEAGKTYYVKGETKWGWPAARARFTMMDEKKGKAESNKIK